MTEEEAKKKVCCGPLHQPEYERVDKIEISKPSLRNCIGSACMAWRTIVKFDPSPPKGMLPKPIGTNGGYCGLAGNT